MQIMNLGIRAMATIYRAPLAALLALLLGWAPTASAQQKAFPTPEEAMNAFIQAVAINDDDAVKGLLGEDYRSIIPPVGADVRSLFLAASAKSRAIVPEGDAKASFTVGDKGWTFPVPLVKTAQGWQFDMVAGADEIRIRRIGRNELAVMQVMLAIHDAQNEYAEKDRDGDGVRAYAAKFESSPGKTDGLYWPTKAGEAPSPLGSVFAAAKAAGGSKATGYYGYHYKLLNGQGKNAPGGAYDYVAKGKKLGGFAVAAWPVKYGDTGVMTFMISHDGVLYEKDLGMSTEARAKAVTRFDPDSTWRKVQPAY